MSTTVTTEELANSIKGLGPAKANLIQSHLDDTDDASVKSLASIRGVSTALAKRVVAYLETHDYEEPAADAVEEEPEVKEEGSTPAPSTNGHHVRNAGEVRLFARQMEEFGYREEADELRTRVSAYLDNEDVALA